ncbi:MAG: hypothetical protein GY722_10515 [bacterium]|nr:hypothetical protein [bacterium]
MAYTTHSPPPIHNLDSGVSLTYDHTGSSPGGESVDRRILVFPVIVALLLGGCSDGENSDSPSFHDGGVESTAPISVGGGDWPSYIPADIPPLGGEITAVMGGSDRLRMFFEGVSDDMVMAYIEQLRDLGYDLDFVVYETPASGDRAQERADAGEWDAVRATKGDYRINLAFGEGNGTMDIEGLPSDAISPDVSWPAAWLGIPAPSTLEIQAVTDFGTNGPLVEASYETEADIVAYVDKLEEEGFEVVNRSFDQNNELISVTVRRDRDELTLRTYPDQRVHVSLMDSADSLLQPPPGGETPALPVATNEFPEWLPEVPGGDIGFAAEDSGGGFTASVTIGDDHTVAEYIEILNAAGFAESGTMIMGHILSNGERTITILGDDGGLPPLQITITVRAEP